MSIFPDFPLYSSLKNKLCGEKITQEDVDEIIDAISKMASSEHEIVYCLIKSYYIDNNINDNIELPYGGKRTKKDIKYRVDDLPDDLQMILLLFVRVTAAKP